MKKPKKKKAEANLTAAQQDLGQLWEEHVRHEFATHNTEDTLRRCRRIRRWFPCRGPSATISLWMK